MQYLQKIGKNAKKAFENLKAVKHNKIKKILNEYNSELLLNKKQIVKENQKDIKSSVRKQLVDRLILNDKRIEGIRHSINEIAKFKNPVGQVLDQWKRPNKLTIKKVSIPIGVIGVIYESRPNVTADVAALCLKSGNCSILRGGSEALNSNKILANLFRYVLQKNKVDKNCVQFIDKRNRTEADLLCVLFGKKQAIRRANQYRFDHDYDYGNRLLDGTVMADQEWADKDKELGTFTDTRAHYLRR